MFKKYPTDQVIAACLIAYQQQGCKVRSMDSVTNKTRVLAILSGKEVKYTNDAGDEVIVPVYTLTESDIADAKEFITEFKSIAMMLELSGKNIFKSSNFHKVCLEIINSQETNNFGAAVYIPNVFNDLEKKDKERVEFSSLASTSTYIGTIGEKISLTFTVIKERYVIEIGCYRYEGHDNNGNIISFLSKHKLEKETSKITGKVKKHEQSKWTIGPTTMLNYVKYLED